MKAQVVSGSPELVYELEIQDLKAFFSKGLDFKTSNVIAPYMNMMIKINRSEITPRSHVYISGNEIVSDLDSESYSVIRRFIDESINRSLPEQKSDPLSSFQQTELEELSSKLSWLNKDDIKEDIYRSTMQELFSHQDFYDVSDEITSEFGNFSLVGDMMNGEIMILERTPWSIDSNYFSDKSESSTHKL
jgi:hypothetical protein